jgi:hypothetical protein
MALCDRWALMDERDAVMRAARDDHADDILRWLVVQLNGRVDRLVEPYRPATASTSRMCTSASIWNAPRSAKIKSRSSPVVGHLAPPSRRAPGRYLRPSRLLPQCRSLIG